MSQIPLETIKMSNGGTTQYFHTGLVLTYDGPLNR